MSDARKAQNRLDRFLAFSAEVTAFTVFRLQGTGQADLYLDVINKILGQALVTELLDVYGAIPVPIAADGQDQRLKRLRQDIFGNEKLGPIARNIIKLWYLGAWFELPPNWNEQHGPLPNSFTFVPSPSSYVEGLLWPAIGAHPEGAKAQGFGSWADPPTIPTF